MAMVRLFVTVIEMTFDSRSAHRMMQIGSATHSMRITSESRKVND